MFVSFKQFEYKRTNMADKDSHMAQDNACGTSNKITGKMNSTIIDCFAKLTNDNDIVRLNGGLSLLQHLSHHNADDDNNKEVKYALTRIVRSLGSSKIFAKKGFYTALTIFLSTHQETPVEKILSLMEAELHPVSSNSKSENADIYMGRILGCGALIRSNLLTKSEVDTQKKTIEILLHAGKQRSYLSVVSISFFIEFLMKVDAEFIKLSIWPIIEEEFGKGWPEQTLDTFYALLVMKDKFPSLIDQKFLKKHLGTEDIITDISIKNITAILIDIPRIICYQHPVFTLFCEKLTLTELVPNFWAGIDEKFLKPSKSDEYVATEILKLIVSNITDKTVLPQLLSPNFLQHMIKKCSNLKKNNDDVVIKFKNLLNLIASVTSSKDVKSKTQISVLKKLIIYPGDLMIEKKTGIKVIQMITAGLNTDGIQNLSKIYKGIIENVIPKELKHLKLPFWTNAKRIYAAHLLTKLIGHPAIISDHEWRIDQLKFLFCQGLCEMPNINVELAPYLKECFYRALDHKLPKLNDLQNILRTLVHYLDSEMSSERIKLKVPLIPAATEAWEKMMQLINKLEKSLNLKASTIFHTINVHMGLQLFSDPDMAIMSIDELQSCYERLIKKPKARKINSKEVEDEPEWVEVVVDLLLSLLSKNSHLMRSLVGCVFPHVCPYLTTAAVYQILAVLDIRNKDSVLDVKDNDDDDDSNNSESEDDSDEYVSDENDFSQIAANGLNGSKNSDLSTSIEADNEEIENNIDSSLDDSESDTEENISEEDETVTDKLRLAVREALGDAAFQTDDEDIDVDQIDEAEGKRLNKMLGDAFKIFRENRQTRSKKQEKSAQTLTHFRVRVTDLLEVYLESGPPMVIALDIIVPLFALLEFCIKDPYQKPLENRVRACLKKLSAIKKFKDTNDVDDNLLESVLKALIIKGERSASVCQEMSDKLAECCIFLIRCVQQVGLSTDKFIKTYKENLIAFFKKRDCVLPAILFKSILQLHWEGNWQLAPLLVDFAFDNTIRSFRRGQALEFLTIFYRNKRLLHENTENVNARLQMEKKLYKNSINTFQKFLCSVDNIENGQPPKKNDINTKKEVNQKFICLLLTLIHTVYTQHLPEVWKWQNLAEKLTTFRAHTTLSNDAKNAYNKLARQIGASINTSGNKSHSTSTSNVNGQVKKNGKESEVSDAESMENNVDTNPVNETKEESKKKKKNKSKRKKNQVLKKEARELRVFKMSEGLEESFKFSSVLLSNSVVTDNNMTVCENKPVMQLNKSYKQKRTIIETTDSCSMPKKKKSNKVD